MGVEVISKSSAYTRDVSLRAPPKASASVRCRFTPPLVAAAAGVKCKLTARGQGQPRSAPHTEHVRAAAGLSSVHAAQAHSSALCGGDGAEGEAPPPLPASGRRGPATRSRRPPPPPPGRTAAAPVACRPLGASAPLPCSAAPPTGRGSRRGARGWRQRPPRDPAGHRRRAGRRRRRRRHCRSPARRVRRAARISTRPDKGA